MTDAESDAGTIVHLSDASTVPPLFQPAWKATPARGRDRLSAMGGDMFSPMKLQQMFQTMSPPTEKENQPPGEAHAPMSSLAGAAPLLSEFTFRARNVPTSTPVPPRSVSVKGATLNAARQAARAREQTSSGARPSVPLTPGGPHVPMRLLHVPMDARVRSGLEQLAEERSREASLDDVSSSDSPPSLAHQKRMRVASHEQGPAALVRPRAAGDATPRSDKMGSFPRSILKSAATAALSQDTPRERLASRSISFADAHRPAAATPHTARWEHMIDELEQLHLSPSVSSTPRARTTPVLAADTSAERSAHATQASFRVTRSKLVELLTDVAPWEPDWRSLRRVDLRARRLESCIGMAEQLPQLEEAWLDHNDVAFTMGLPASVRVLRASHNKLSELASFEHLQRLELVDVSHNDMASLRALGQLPRLRVLYAHHNRLTDVHGLEACASLEHLDVAHNELRGALDVASMQWPQLRHLALAHNRLSDVAGLDTLPQLATLDLDANELHACRFRRRMPCLRELRVSDNTALSVLDVDAPQLRKVYADRCRLRRIDIGAARALRSLSLRQQGTPLETPLDVPAGLERLFLAGNALDGAFLQHALPDLVYLELAGCHLTELGHDVQDATPALRTLNLDYNALTCLPRLARWPRLKRVSAVGCRLHALDDVVRSVRDAAHLCVLDVRANPATLALYPPFARPCDAPESAAADAWCPPLPHPAIVQPDAAAALEQAAQAEWKAARALAERSQFHKRTMLLPAEPAAGELGTQHAADGARYAALFRAADRAFVTTLPRATAYKRYLYRGLCGLSCASLTWLDGLEVLEGELERAEHLIARHVSS